MAKRHVFSAEDVSYIKQNYLNTSVTKLAAHCGVGVHTMQNELERLGLRADESQSHYSEFDIYRLKELASKGSSVDEIADALGRTRRSVESKAKALGVRIKGYAGNWRVDDMDTLRRKWGRVPLASLVKELKRTETAIRTQAGRMKLPKCYYQSEDIPLSEFCRDTGISRSSITKTLVIKFDFPLKSAKPGCKRMYLYVDSERILPWLQSHQSLYNAAGIPEYYFGVEPDWLVKKRCADKQFATQTISTRYKMTRWTKDEECRLRDCIKSGQTFEQMADQFDRTVDALKNKASRMGLSYTSPVFWRGKDFKAIAEGVETKSDAELSAELDRPVSSVISHRVDIGISRKVLAQQRRESDMEYVSGHWKSESDADMAAKLRRSVRYIESLRGELGLWRGQNQYHRIKG